MSVIPSAEPPAILGGSPAFPEGLPISRPSVEDSATVAAHIRRILDSGVLTNGPTVRRLEEAAAQYLGVHHCVAVSSCTAGLMLVLRAAELSGDVIVPSFTFMATAHAVVWNGLRPVFADVDGRTLTLSPTSVERAVGPHTSAVLATHVYGTPCDVEGLAEVASRYGVRLFFDAAHAFGSSRRGVRVGGFGGAEVFSLSPTKILVAGEGGIVATNDDLLGERIRMGRDYGNPGDYDCRFVGLNARMSELHAAVALASLRRLDDRIDERNRIAERYSEALDGIPGIGFAEVGSGDRSTFKDFTLRVDPRRFGLRAEGLAAALAAEGIETRRYFSPPVHAMRAYAVGNGRPVPLDATAEASAQVVSLPIWSGMPDGTCERVAWAVERIGRSAAGGGGSLTSPPQERYGARPISRAPEAP